MPNGSSHSVVTHTYYHLYDVCDTHKQLVKIMHLLTYCVQHLFKGTFTLAAFDAVVRVRQLCVPDK